MQGVLISSLLLTKARATAIIEKARRNRDVEEGKEVTCIGPVECEQVRWSEASCRCALLHLVSTPPKSSQNHSIIMATDESLGAFLGELLGIRQSDRQEGSDKKRKAAIAGIGREAREDSVKLSTNIVNVVGAGFDLKSSKC